MAYAWFICPFLLDTTRPGEEFRYCAMNNFNAAIYADGGWWAETEVLGNVGLVKVRASESTLATIAAETGFHRIQNHWLLSDTLADLTTAQRNAIQNRLLQMGYTQAEIDAALGSNLNAWRQKTLAALLSFIATRRRKPRWSGGQVVCDGAVVTPRSVASVDAEVV